METALTALGIEPTLTSDGDMEYLRIGTLTKSI